MTTFKGKALKPEYTDEQIKTMCGVTRFISFGACIDLFREKFKLTDSKEDPIGYRVTEQGIEILQK